MKVLILSDTEAATSRAADILCYAVACKPAATLGLATGGTMLPLYAALAERCSAGRVSFARATTFNLDEYVGVGPEHPCSFHRYMVDAFFDSTDIDPANAHLPRGDAPDPDTEAASYEARIVAAGGIDLQLLGIGQNGHIGFNEPTSSLGSRTRIKTLTESTRAANQPYFDSDEDVPRFAITMGIATILEARACLMLATGPAKAKAVAAMIEGPVSAYCPASALQLHPKVTVVLDKPAASHLRQTDYYHHVHPNGCDRVLA
jgi:glucosamine-6-phosphate deaminase